MESLGPFRVRMVALEEGESHYELVGRLEDLELEADGFELLTPITLRATLYRIDSRVEVRGQLGASIRQVCGRCLCPFTHAIGGNLRVYAEPRDTRDFRPDEEVREDDLGIVYHDGQCVDLTDEVRQVFQIEVPWHPVCKGDCRGLCPKCGVNRNEVSCVCHEDVVDPRWEALRRIRDKKE